MSAVSIEYACYATHVMVTWVIGFVEFIGLVGFIEFVGLVGLRVTGCGCYGLRVTNKLGRWEASVLSLK